MEIRVDKSIYSKQVLLKTAYSFTDKAYLHLSQDDHSWIIHWTNMPDQKTDPLIFENELLSQQLREELIEKTKDIRELLLSRAFASSALKVNNFGQKELDNAKDEMINERAEGNEANILKGWFDT